jgi:hypothetical protein
VCIVSPGTQPDGCEALAAFRDLPSDGVSEPDVDWLATEFERVAEQTLGDAPLA